MPSISLINYCLIVGIVDFLIEFGEGVVKVVNVALIY